MRVLVVDDERNIRTPLRVCLEGFGCEVREAATPEAGRRGSPGLPTPFTRRPPGGGLS